MFWAMDMMPSDANANVIIGRFFPGLTPCECECSPIGRDTAWNTSSFASSVNIQINLDIVGIIVEPPLLDL